MRLVSADIKQVSSFDSFIYKDSSPEGQNTRIPKGTLISDINNARRSRKVIITSDDEDDGLKNSISNDGWLEKRDHRKISDSEKILNQREAKKIIQDRRISKRPRPEGDNAPVRSNQIENDDGIVDTSESDCDDRKRKLETLVKKRKLLKANNRSVRLDRRKNATTHVKSRRDEDSTDSSSSEENSEELRGTPPSVDGDDNDNEGDWDNDANDNVDIFKHAQHILDHCSNVSTGLRRALKRWQGSRHNAAVLDVSSDDSQDSSKAAGSGPAATSCVDLTAIASDCQDDGEVLLDSDIWKLCPGLELKEYQLVGVNWLKLLHQNNVNGVLADDMGLGKTIQTIAFLGWLHSSTESSGTRRRPHLIIVPGSTLSNWINELRRFCPSFVVTCYHGSQDERYCLRKKIKRDIEQQSVQIIIATYTIFERESGVDDRVFLQNIAFEYLVLDEAHCLKNAESSRHVQLTKLQCKHRLLLSGTPVQNDLKELLSLLSFLMPKVFKATDCDILLEAFKGIGVESLGKRRDQLSLARLREMLAPFVLRRLKRDVLSQLVPKECTLEMVQMTDSQRKLYEAILSGHAHRKEALKAKFEEEERAQRLVYGGRVVKNVITINDCCSEVIPTAADGANKTAENSVQSNQSKVDTADACVRQLTATEANSLFTALRKAANHPLLLRNHYKDESVLDLISSTAFEGEHFGTSCTLAMVRLEVENMSDFDLNRLCIDFPRRLGHLQLSDAVLYESPKMVKLEQMLPTLVKEGHRILIFSQWTKLLDLLEVLMDDLDLAYLRLDGSTPVKERQDLIDRFNAEDIPVFLLATKAGGLGINLTAADTVILHDVDFNPEGDRQAEDRCHRIGQTRAVRVIRLVTADTVDEAIYDLAERKKRLSNAVLADEQGDDSDSKMDIKHILQRALEMSIDRVGKTSNIG